MILVILSCLYAIIFIAGWSFALFFNGGLKNEENDKKWKS